MAQSIRRTGSGFETDGLNERVEVVDEALIEPVEQSRHYRAKPLASSSASARKRRYFDPPVISASRPLSRAAGLGGQPGMTRSTGTTLETPPAMA
jgi:hypothetical protein